eukprot:CAMPEP_0114557482 /NCGR_PEP_ID=MMETSP0114-20121206/9855_1 /TAXON_ID=31324 /ORGANISM="Goniomonas sp, Strain m" /LENGTH=50 /DNA_ID=CAMNT_0001742775 /DNA_START=447 /DNA_END=599 /DNA_ORIENTATION=+
MEVEKSGLIPVHCPMGSVVALGVRLSESQRRKAFCVLTAQRIVLVKRWGV